MVRDDSLGPGRKFFTLHSSLSNTLQNYWIILNYASFFLFWNMFFNVIQSYSILYQNICVFSWLSHGNYVSLWHERNDWTPITKYGSHGTRDPLLSTHSATECLAETPWIDRWRTGIMPSCNASPPHLPSSRSKQNLPSAWAALKAKFRHFLFPFWKAKETPTFLRRNSDFGLRKLPLYHKVTQRLLNATNKLMFKYAMM